MNHMAVSSNADASAPVPSPTTPCDHEVVVRALGSAAGKARAARTKTAGMLVGRPDRIVREGESFIPEEWKSSKRVNRGHELQLGTYFLLIEDEYGVRPPHGFVVLGDGRRVRVENTEALRSEVLSIAEKIREHRARIAEEIPVGQPAWKCRACGQRGACTQARA